MAKNNLFKSYDMVTTSITVALIIIGWLNIYAADYSPDSQGSLFSLKASAGKQLMFIILAFIAGLFIFLMEGKFFRTFAYGFYGLFIFLLLLVLVLAKSVNGNAAWIDLGGGFKLQPAEFSKLGTALALSAYLGSYNVDIRKWKDLIRAVFIIFVPMALILLQGDLGSMLVYTSLMFVLYRAGSPPIWYFVVFVVATISVLSLIFEPKLVVTLQLLATSAILINQLDYKFRAWVILFIASVSAIGFYVYGWPIVGLSIAGVMMLGVAIMIWARKWQPASLALVVTIMCAAYSYSVNYIFFKIFEPHQQCRVLVWLRPDRANEIGCDDHNIVESQKAIASGSFLGKGYLNGDGAQMDRVPEQTTDFIFCTIGEEHGFMGSLLLIVLYAILLIRIVMIAERQRASFSRHYAYAIACIVFTHFFINIGMTVGLMPIIGIPLPFISYGGSSLLAFTVMMAILIKLDSIRLQVFR